MIKNQALSALNSNKNQSQNTTDEGELNLRLNQFEKNLSAYFQNQQKNIDSIHVKIENFHKINPIEPIPILPQKWSFCKKGHNLFWNKHDKDFICSLCQEKARISFFGCEKCEEVYCCKCYPPFLKKNGKCPLDHAIIGILSIFEKCNLCSKTLKLLGFNDPLCNLFLCKKCKDKISD